MTWLDQARTDRPPRPAPDPFDTAEMPTWALPVEPDESVQSRLYRERETLPEFTSEEQLADHVLGELDPYFHIQREVWGTHCSGRRLRIDAVLRPRECTDWADGDDAAFGVEFKLPLGGSQSAKWISQCFDYTHTVWDGYGRLGIFACPDVRMGWTPEGDAAAAHILGQMRVGELVKHRRYGWSLVLHTHHRQWSQVRGAEDARRTRLRPAIGSR